jgi:hypothetical protein
MNKVMDRLQFQVELEELLRQGKTFEDILEDDWERFQIFIKSPQGKKWLTKPSGQAYLDWQKS